MQHLEWTHHGRRYHHQDEGKPNTFTVTTGVGEVNVDVQGDGSTFAPYVRAGATLRHGNSECTFADGWQELRHLGNVVLSKSQLYIQRDVGGVWTDVPHGLPARNVLDEYPREGRCTAYLDFDQIQGYASGARFQIGVEAGGSDAEIYGFRFRSPVAGTFRLEWVLEIPQDADLAWLTDADGTRVGGRVGSVSVQWAPGEAARRDATSENDGQGGRVLRVILGPYTVGALEWLTIYPDVVSGTVAAAEDDGFDCDLTGWGAVGQTIRAGAFLDIDLEIWFHYSAGVSFTMGSAIPAGASIDSAYFRAYTISYTTVELAIRVEDADPSTNTPFGASHRIYGGATWVTDREMVSHSYTGLAWYYGQNDSYPEDLASDIQHLVDSFGEIAAGDRINVAIYNLSNTDASCEFHAYEKPAGNPAQLSVTYTLGGAGPSLVWNRATVTRGRLTN